MAENPLATLVRLVGGVALMQGNIGHQVLGQLLVTNTNEVAIAGAALVVAATTGQRSVVGQMALRTVVPALAVRTLLNSQQERLERKEGLLEDRERKLEQRADAVAKEEAALARRRRRRKP